MSNHPIHKKHNRDGARQLILSCLMLMTIGCSPTASFIYKPSTISYDNQDPGQKDLLVVSFQDVREQVTTNPKLIGSTGPLISIYSKKTVTEIITSAVASELKSAGFNVKILGDQTGVRKEGITKLLTEQHDNTGQMPAGVIWGTINDFFYQGGSFNKATVDITYYLLAPNSGDPIHSNQRSCSTSARGKHAALEVATVLFIPLLFGVGYIEREFAESLLSECMQQNVQQELSGQKKTQTIRLILNESSR